MKISKKRKKIINNKTTIKYGGNNIRKKIIDILKNNKNYLKIFLLLEKKIKSNTRISNKLINEILNLSNNNLVTKDYDNIRSIIKTNNNNKISELLIKLNKNIKQSGGGMIYQGIGLIVFTIIASLIYKINNNINNNKINNNINNKFNRISNVTGIPKKYLINKYKGYPLTNDNKHSLNELYNIGSWDGWYLNLNKTKNQNYRENLIAKSGFLDISH